MKPTKAILVAAMLSVTVVAIPSNGFAIPFSWEVIYLSFTPSTPEANKGFISSAIIPYSLDFHGTAWAYAEATFPKVISSSAEVTWELGLRLLGDPGAYGAVNVSAVVRAANIETGGSGQTALVVAELSVDDVDIMKFSSGINATVSGESTASIQVSKQVGDVLRLRGTLIAAALAPFEGYAISDIRGTLENQRGMDFHINSVPDSSPTVLLLGLAMAGVVRFRLKLARQGRFKQ